MGGNLFNGSARAFNHRTEVLRAACERLGGTPGTVGDVSYTIPLFGFFPVTLQFWDGDEEFDPVLKLMWDRRTLDFMRYETTYYAADHLLQRLVVTKQRDGLSTQPVPLLCYRMKLVCAGASFSGRPYCSFARAMPRMRKTMFRARVRMVCIPSAS